VIEQEAVGALRIAEHLGRKERLQLGVQDRPRLGGEAEARAAPLDRPQVRRRGTIANPFNPLSNATESSRACSIGRGLLPCDTTGGSRC